MLKENKGINMEAKKAIFLDKDGTLINDIPFNVDLKLITFSSNILDGLKLLQEEGYIFIIITNQSGIGKGYFNHKDVDAVGARLELLLARAGIVLSGFYYCPHIHTVLSAVAGTECDCRKPKPGMLLTAAQVHNIDLSSSWMIGDILNDVEAGNRAGCKTILINNGNETKWEMTDKRTPDYIADSIDTAARYILDINLLNQFYAICQHE